MGKTKRSLVPDIASLSFWIDTWKKVADHSLLRKSQEDHPQRWADFYEKVAECWKPMGGEGEDTERAMVEALFQQKVILPQKTVLDLGCGPGPLSLLLAEKGARVTALDLSPSMLAILREKAKAVEIKELKIIARDWEQYKPRTRFDLVLASGFPQACTPAGISRLESFSRSHCALILGDGHDPFPFRRLLWKRIMKSPLPEGKANLHCLIHYLLVTGRAPQIGHFRAKVTLDLPQEQVLYFYQEYFALFGKSGPKTKALIRDTLIPFGRKGRVRAQGQKSSVLIWWKKPEESHFCPKGIWGC